MVDYEKKYLELTRGILKCIPDVSEEFPNANGFEKAIISMRKLGWSYGDIQLKLGMPSKKQIRTVLLKWAPELIDNSKKKVIEISEYESELYNIIKSKGSSVFEIEGEEWKFFLRQNELWCIDSWDEEFKFSNYNTITQAQILNQIKEQLDGY